MNILYDALLLNKSTSMVFGYFKSAAEIRAFCPLGHSHFCIYDVLKFLPAKLKTFPENRPYISEISFIRNSFPFFTSMFIVSRSSFTNSATDFRIPKYLLPPARNIPVTSHLSGDASSLFAMEDGGIK